ncbi:MAG: 1-acyl-sn-glycerol-3-phosphate acyltransferase [Methylococcaceae bacterium]|nr:1-acyl-sn-glycerol-3-phosphate acyltransferase [Methylococcaceae bacterium]
MKLKLRLLYKLFRIILLFINGLIIAGGIFPVIDVLWSANDAKTKRDALKIRWLTRFCGIVNLHIIQEGTSPEPGALIVSNHISWLDIIAIGQCVPAYFIAKSDISSWPIIGYLAKQGGTLFIRRGDKQHIRTMSEKMVWLLKQNASIVAFPEGTTTNGDGVLAFHPSLFQPALLTRCPVQPVAIQYLGAARFQAPFIGDDDFISHLFKILSLEKFEVKLTFLPAISSRDNNRRSISAETRNLIFEIISGATSTGNAVPPMRKHL